MQIRYTSRLSLLILSFVAAMLIFPAVAFAETVAPDGTTGASLPTIQSDKADYPPGATVTLTGSGWQPGESVHIYVNDNDGQTWSHDTDVTADASGNITDQFNLPDWFVATYKVTATGAQSGVATSSFTDGNVGLNLAATEGVAQMTVTYDRYDGSTTCSGTPTSTNLTVSTTSGSSVNIPGFGGANDSVRLKSVSTTTSRKTFDKWTNGQKVGGNVVDTGMLTPGSPTPCKSNGSGTNGNIDDILRAGGLPGSHRQERRAKGGRPDDRTPHGPGAGYARERGTERAVAVRDEGPRRKDRGRPPRRAGGRRSLSSYGEGVREPWDPSPACSWPWASWPAATKRTAC